MNRAQIYLSIRLCLLAGLALPVEIEIPLCVSVACVALVAFSFWLDSVRRLPPQQVSLAILGSLENDGRLTCRPACLVMTASR